MSQLKLSNAMDLPGSRAGALLKEGKQLLREQTRRRASIAQNRSFKWAAPASNELTWGRQARTSIGTTLGSISIMALCPVLVIMVWIALEHFDGAISQALLSLVTQPQNFVEQYLPTMTIEEFIGYSAWVAFQAALYAFLPSPLRTGQLTPAGHLLQYYTNGLSAWVVSASVFACGSWFNVIDPAVIAKHWTGLLIAANCYGFIISTFAFLKAYIAPTHPGDRKFSGSAAYDFYMGIEFNPRIGKYWDFKLFTNGRPGIIAWMLIDASFTAWQYQLHGYISNSILIADLLHLIYVIDFFINEDWYLRTIDICHDHFGFYLAWGSYVWLPAMYTLQTQYLARYPVNLSPVVAAAILSVGVGGYALFRSVNYQKDLVRRTDGQCTIWNKEAEVIRCQFTTKDGEQHNSLLLCSGWWGFSRHANYLGDLILSYMMCATCGLTNLIPWTYAIFMTVLLLHRSLRSDQRCAEKYGEKWTEYCQKVKWCLIPGIY